MRYAVALSEFALGWYANGWGRGYREQHIGLAEKVFTGGFAALATYLHEHAHVFGTDGSRRFTDALTELIECVVTHRRHVDALEACWEEARAGAGRTVGSGDRVRSAGHRIARTHRGAAVGSIRELLQRAQERTQHRLAAQAMREVQECVVGDSVNWVPYVQLDRHGKLELLSDAIDWGAYIDRGMHPDTPPLIMFNAVDGKPPERWLEQSPQEAEARRAEMVGYAAQFEAAVRRIRASIQAREVRQSVEEHRR